MNKYKIAVFVLLFVVSCTKGKKHLVSDVAMDIHDVIVIGVDDNINYSLNICDSTTYLLIFNGQDSLVLPPFIWENALLDGFLVDGDVKSRFFQASDSIYFLSVPVGMGGFYLIGVEWTGRRFELEKNSKNWLFSEAGFFVFTSSRTIAIPIIRGRDYGKVIYYKYGKNGSPPQKAREKWIDYEQNPNIQDLLDDKEFAKKIREN